MEKGNLEKPLILYNRTASKADEHSKRIGNSTVAKSLAELVAKSDIIWSCLQNDTAVTEIFEQILVLDVKGKLFLESSTIVPEHADNLAEKCIAAGAEYVAMPVFGDHTVAAAGRLICVPAGATESVHRVLPYLEGVIGKKVINLSNEEPSKASLLKIIGNVLIISTMETVGEVKVFGEKAGVGSQYIRDMIEAYMKIAPIMYAETMTSGGYFNKEPMVEVAKARDLGSRVLNLADSLNVSLDSYRAGINHMEVAEYHGGSKCDVTSIYGAIRVESGLPFRNDCHEDVSREV